MYAKPEPHLIKNKKLVVPRSVCPLCIGVQTHVLPVLLLGPSRGMEMERYPSPILCLCADGKFFCLLDAGAETKPKL